MNFYAVINEFIKYFSFVKQALLNNKGVYFGFIITSKIRGARG